MFSKAVSYGFLWDIAASEDVRDDQRWILSAMQKYGPGLITLLWRILGNEQDVCDAYQDTFLQLAHHESGPKPKYVKAYIFKTANNVAISMIRRRIADQRKISFSIAKEASVTSPAKELDTKYLQESLRFYIAQMPEHLRNVIVLRDLAELSYAKIGKILGISAATARVYRCKALHMLSVFMDKENHYE